MNKEQRAKARALAQCRFLPEAWEARFARNLAWCAEHVPELALTPKQRYALDQAVYTFRRQLAGQLPTDYMLTQPPEKEDYGIEDPPQTVADLFTGERSAPHPTQDHDLFEHPQRKLV